MKSEARQIAEEMSVYLVILACVGAFLYVALTERMCTYFTALVRSAATLGQ